MVVKLKHSEKFYNKVLKSMMTRLGNDTTFGSDLQSVGNKLLGRKFVGVFPSDRIPRLNGLRKYAIINLDSSGMPGSHWIAVAHDKGTTYVYDSFGRKTRKIIPAIFNSGNGKIVMTEDDAEQRIKENNCGQRCLAWLMVFDKLGIKSALEI